MLHKTNFWIKVLLTLKNSQKRFIALKNHIATVAFLMMLSPTIAVATPLGEYSIPTPNGTLQILVNNEASTATISGDGQILSTVDMREAYNMKPVNTPSGSAILIHYHTGITDDCGANQWFSILPGGQYKMSSVFGKCYRVKDIHAHGNSIIFKQYSVKGKGYMIRGYSIKNGNLSMISSHLVAKNILKIVVPSSETQYTPVYGKIVHKLEYGRSYYVFEFPQKVEFTGNVPENFYEKSVEIYSHKIMSIKGIGKNRHYLALITCPMLGPMIEGIRPN